MKAIQIMALAGGLVLAAMPAAADKLNAKSQAEMAKLLNLVATADQVGEVKFGELASGEVATIAFAGVRDAGYYFNAVCDDDCTNLDLAVKDAAGMDLDLDDADDNAPVVNVVSEFGEKGARPLTVEVRMKACRKATCAYAFRIGQTD